MKRSLFLCIAIVLFSCDLLADRTADFEIAIPTEKIEGSYYNRLQYLDSRLDKSKLGYIFSTMSGGTEVVDKVSLKKQFQSLMEGATDQSTEGRTLLVQLRKLSFGVDLKKNPKNGCNLRISFFEADGDNYYFVNTIDTIIESKHKEALADASVAINAIFAENLLLLPLEDEEPFSLTEVKDIDALERNTIPLFTETELPEGVYFDYKSLSKLIPSVSDMKLIINSKGIKELEIKDPNNSNKTKKLKPKDVYAIVADGELYISYDKKFCRVFEEDGNLKFVGTQDINSGLIAGASFGMGSGGSYGGGISLNLGPKPKNYLKLSLDQFNGDFIFEGYVND